MWPLVLYFASLMGFKMWYRVHYPYCEICNEPVTPGKPPRLCEEAARRFKEEMGL